VESRPDKKETLITEFCHGNPHLQIMQDK